ncbi:MAG: hypothetical protein A2Y40_09990 [Candidatus Margulisbacteria bacterium GWF2_35_9]|nr:MAG: hypothetical protein A2Y40_09990 [Candidatus Margulisbacteria bacterium GWF2_35_9]
MKKQLLNLLCISIFLSSSCLTNASDISLGYLHPQLSGIGNTGIAYYGNTNAAILNPAILAHYNGWSFYNYDTLFENEIHNTHYNFTHSLWDMVFYHSYYSQVMNGIPITSYIDDRIRQNGEFSASINQYKLGIAKKINDFLFFKDFDIGASFALQKYSFDSQSYFYHSYGLVASTYIWDNLYFGTVLDIANDSLQMNYGIHYTEEDYGFFLDYHHNDIKTGIDYKMNQYLHLRSGIEPRYYCLGLGLFYDNLYGPLNINLALQFDYTYMLPINETIYSPSSYFSITIQELEKLTAPLIYRYPPFTNERYVAIDGWAPRNSTIWIYVNDQVVSKTQSNSNGQWETMIPLDGNINRVKAKTVRLLDQKSSNFSKEVQISIDDIPPTLYLTGVVENNVVDLVLIPNELLKSEPVILLPNKKTLTIPLFLKKYQLKHSTEAFIESLNLKIFDLAGNVKTETLEYPFIKFILPEQKTITTYKDKYLFKGSSHRKYAKIRSINSKTKTTQFVTIEKSGTFDQIIDLGYGLNTIIFEEFLDKGEFKYPFKIIRLFHFNDIDNSEYDKLATIGVLEMDELFHPERKVSQQDIVTWLVKYKAISFGKVPDKEWLSLAYDYAIDNHWIDKRDEYKLITRKQAMDIFSLAMPLDIHSTQKEESYFSNIALTHPYLKTINYFVEQGLISRKYDRYILDAFITKDEFCNWLIRTPQKDILINRYFND